MLLLRGKIPCASVAELIWELGITQLVRCHQGNSDGQWTGVWDGI